MATTSNWRRYDATRKRRCKISIYLSEHELALVYACCLEHSFEHIQPFIRWLLTEEGWRRGLWSQRVRPFHDPSLKREHRIPPFDALAQRPEILDVRLNQQELALMKHLLEQCGFDYKTELARHLIKEEASRLGLISRHRTSHPDRRPTP